MQKKTEDLVNEIVTGGDIARYLESNRAEFLDTPLPAYLKQLLAQRQLRVAQVVERAHKGEYLFQVFRGIKKPSRDIVLCIALAMGLGVAQAGLLLRIARLPALDARNRRDSILLFALNRGLTVPDTNDLLFELQQPCL